MAEWRVYEWACSVKLIDKFTVIAKTAEEAEEIMRRRIERLHPRAEADVRRRLISDKPTKLREV